MHNRFRKVPLLIARMRALLPYALLGILFLVGVTVVTSVTDGDAAAKIVRRAFRSFAGAIGSMASLMAFLVSVEFMRDYLRKASGSPLYHWPSTVGRSAIRMTIVVAVLWCGGYLIGELLRGLSDGTWLADKMLRGAIRSAGIGALLGAGAVALEVLSTNRSAKEGNPGHRLVERT